MAKIDYLTKSQSERLLQVVHSKKHKAAFLLMMDCGLKVSECMRLKLSDFDFKRRILWMRSPKQRKGVREVSISDRCYASLSDYISSLSREEIDQGTVFSASQKEMHNMRHSINRLCEQIRNDYPEFAGLRPHILRRLCTTHLPASEAELHEVKSALGHSKHEATLIYTYGLDLLTIGREEEINKLTSLIDRGINVLLLGEIGMGKTHLINVISNIEGKKVLRFDDLSEIKRTLLNMLLYLYRNDLSRVKDLVYGQYDLESLKIHLQRDSVNNLCREIIRITPKYAYVLVVDNCDRLTPKGVRVLEELKDHFVVLAGAREVLMKYSSFAWNFEVIRLKELSRRSALELITRLSRDIKTEDYDLLKNHIYEQSDGNPRVICEMIERYRKEPIITIQTIRSITHMGNLKEYDFSPILLLGLAGISTFRFMSGELENDSLRFIGGIAILLLVVLRNMFSFTKRKKL